MVSLYKYPHLDDSDRYSRTPQGVHDPTPDGGYAFRQTPDQHDVGDPIDSPAVEVKSTVDGIAFTPFQLLRPQRGGSQSFPVYRRSYDREAGVAGRSMPVDGYRYFSEATKLTMPRVSD